MDQLTTIQIFSVWVLPILFAITVHEVAHGFVAYLYGDRTALILGRLTLNPIKHIDLIGTILVPCILFYLGGFIFGWAKPVPVNVRNLRNPKYSIIMVAAAGPIANVLMMIFWAFIAKVGAILLQHGISWALALSYMGGAGITINALLAVLNLVPIPPLDGGQILKGLLPARAAMLLQRIEPFGFWILLLVLASGLLRYIAVPLTMGLSRLISQLFGI